MKSISENLFVAEQSPDDGRPLEQWEALGNLADHNDGGVAEGSEGFRSSRISGCPE